VQSPKKKNTKQVKKRKTKFGDEKTEEESSSFRFAMNCMDACHCTLILREGESPQRRKAQSTYPPVPQ
jgi:hypothetical protein